MSDTDPQTAAAKVLWHFAMSLDGFAAGPNHQMDWMSGVSFRRGPVVEYVTTTGAVLGEGIRLYDNPGADPIRLDRVDAGDPIAAVNVRCRPRSPAATDS
jgi:hypothetical protein